MDALDQDILAVFSRRATGIAACTRGVKVFLNAFSHQHFQRLRQSVFEGTYNQFSID
jgi:hypothetical protein